MRLLLISDLHGKIENLEKLRAEFESSDAVVFAGDFTEFEKYDASLPAVKKLREMHEDIFCVLGNCDKPELLEALEKQDMCCERGIVYFEGLAFAGSGGGSKFTGTTPNERAEEYLLSDFDVVKNAALDAQGQWGNLILISHNPPKGILCDECAPNVHVGSALLYDFVMETKPLALVCGHIHEGRAIDKIGETVVVNPGSLAEGNYAILEAEKIGEEWKVANVELKNLFA